MNLTLTLLLGLLMVGTALLSGIFGMAGGLVLIGVLLAILPVQQAMVLHAITQIASNGWRGLLWWRFVRWRPVANFLSGAALALLAMSLVRYVPTPAVAMLLLGATPFLVRLLPDRARPNPDSLAQGAIYGSACMVLMLLTGVSGPLMDTYFLGGRMERREIVATKAACQIASHAAKLAYFGGIVAGVGTIDPWLAALAVAASLTGTTLAKPLLERLSETQYRSWANRLITLISAYYLLAGAILLLA